MVLFSEFSLTTKTRIVPPTKFRLARQKVLQSEKALRDFLRNDTWDLEMESKLTGAVKSAKTEFVDSVSSLFPDIIHH